MTASHHRGPGSTADWIFFDKRPHEPTLPRHDGTPGSASERLLAAYPEQAAVPWPQGFDGGLVHRLDNGTSGLLVAARSLLAMEEARERFAGGTLRKRYRFLTDRDVPWDSHTVTAPLAHDRKDRRKMVWQRGARTPHRGKWYPAHTGFSRVGRHGGLHVWEAVITTGVTHQIRVHAASVGLALCGDRLYGGTDTDEGRFFLHHEQIDGWPGGTPRLPAPWTVSP